jgi:phosphoribosylaminoimidazole carboxylase PurE protein
LQQEAADGMSNAGARVGIIMGSDSDWEVMQEAGKVLDELGVPWEATVASAHRTPHLVRQYAEDAKHKDYAAIIAGAGAAAHLAGVLAAETIVPVIGVPIDSSPLNGLDALLATAQMPGGVAVACMAIGKAGARNAGVFAAQILARSDADVAASLEVFRQRMVEQVEAKAGALATRIAHSR